MTSGKLRVVYAAGSGHTGSTLLALLLDAHPRIVSVGETAITPRIRRRGKAAQRRCSCGETMESCPLWRKIFDHVRARGHAFGPNLWTNDYRSDYVLGERLLTRTSRHTLVRTLQRWCGDHLPVHAHRLRRADVVNVAFVRAALEVSGSDVFCDTTKDVLRLWRLRHVPEIDLKVIRLVRDVRGYAASAKRRGLSVAHSARTWRTDQELVLEIARTLPKENTFLLKYEELCTNTTKALRQLYQFCSVEDIEPITSVLATNHHVLGNGMRLKGTIHVRLNESWRTTLSVDEQNEALRVAGAMNESLGYHS
jgi:hypothetical protein